MNNDQEPPKELSLEQSKQLIIDLEKMFQRQNLENNSFMIYRMNQNLEISIYDALKSIRQQTNYYDLTDEQIISVLEQVKNVTLLNNKKVLKPIILESKNKLIITNVKEESQYRFKSFIAQIIDKMDCETMFDRYNCCRIVFKKEDDAFTFFNWIMDQSFEDKKLNPYFEPENIYLNLLQKANEMNRQNEDCSQIAYDQYMSQYYDQMNYYQKQYKQCQDACKQYQDSFNFYIRRARESDNHEQFQAEQQQMQRYPQIYQQFMNPMMYQNFFQNNDNQFQREESDQKQEKMSRNKRDSKSVKSSKYPKKYQQDRRESSSNKTQQPQNSESRARLDSDQFPELHVVKDKTEEESKPEVPEIKEVVYKYSKEQIQNVFKTLKNKVEVSEQMLQVDQKLIPIVNDKRQSLECYHPTKIVHRKDSEFSTPGLTPRMTPGLTPRVFPKKQEVIPEEQEKQKKTEKKD